MAKKKPGSKSKKSFSGITITVGKKVIQMHGDDVLRMSQASQLTMWRLTHNQPVSIMDVYSLSNDPVIQEHPDLVAFLKEQAVKEVVSGLKF